LKIVVAALKWIARILSVVSIFMLAGSFAYEDIVTESMTFKELTMLLCFPVGVIFGMIIAWWWEGIGGGITLMSLIGLYIFSYIFFGVFPEGNEYVKYSSPGMFFIFYSLITYNARHRNDLF
jgi:hypothetical protein